MRQHLFTAAVAGTLATTLLLWGQVVPSPAVDRIMDWTVLVVDDVTGKPVPGAKVWTVTGGPANSRHMQPGYFGKNHQEFLRRHRVAAKADEHGFARMPGQSGMSATAVAEHHGLQGRAWASFCGTGRIGPLPQPEARLAPVTQQKVWVTDASGFPVEGAQIGIAIENDLKGRFLLAMTDGDGRATLHLRAEHRRELAKENAHLYVQSLGFEPVRKFSAEPFHDVVHFQLPKARRVEIEFRNPDGSRCLDTIDFHISNLNDSHWGRFYGGTTNGSFSIPAIGPGKRYFLRAEAWNHFKAGWADTFEIPEKIGGVLTLQVQLVWTDYLIQGRCLLPDGKPLSNAIIHAEWTLFEPDDPSWEPLRKKFTLHTSSDGHFMGPKEGGLFFEMPWRELKFFTIQNGVRYHLDLPDYETLDKGPLNLGEITLKK